MFYNANIPQFDLKVKCWGYFGTGLGQDFLVFRTITWYLMVFKIYKSLLIMQKLIFINTNKLYYSNPVIPTTEQPNYLVIRWLGFLFF